MSASGPDRCEFAEVTFSYALQSLPAGDMSAMNAHVATCSECQQTLASLKPMLQHLVCWSTDVLRPPTDLRPRLAARIAGEPGTVAWRAPQRPWREPDWEAVAPGIECKLLSTDSERHRVSMLVRLAPGARYPAHTHAGVEELHLLDGELWIDGRKLVPGDYNYGASGAGDELVWSATGCTCVLITSTRDVLR